MRRSLRRCPRKGLDQIGPVARALERFARSNKTPDDVAALSDALDLEADATLSIIDVAEKDPVLFEKLNAAVDNATARSRSRSVVSHGQLFETAAAYARDLKPAINEALRKDGVYVQLGAWIIQGGQNRPLHLDGFDDYPEGDFVAVDRWTLSMTEQQRRQIEVLDDTAKAMNKEGFQELLKIGNLTTTAINEFVEGAGLRRQD